MTNPCPLPSSIPQSLGERCASQRHQLAPPSCRSWFNEGDASRRQPTRPSPPPPSPSQCSARGTDTFSGGAWRACSLGETSLCADARPGVGACQGFNPDRRPARGARRAPRSGYRATGLATSRRPTPGSGSGVPSTASSGENTTKIPAQPGRLPGMKCRMNAPQHRADAGQDQVAGEPPDRPLQQEHVHGARSVDGARRRGYFAAHAWGRPQR